MNSPNKRKVTKTAAGYGNIKSAKKESYDNGHKLTREGGMTRPQSASQFDVLGDVSKGKESAKAEELAMKTF